MASNDLGNALASVGGALGAQATGGAAAVAKFLEGMQTKELKAAERDFARETQLRGQLFQQSRDRKQREHDLQLLKTKDDISGARLKLEQTFQLSRDKAARTHDVALTKLRDTTKTDQEFTTETKLLDRKFQASQNKAQRAHEINLQKLREDAGKGRVNRQAANALAVAASQDPDLARTLSDSISTSIPALADVAQGLDWNNAELAGEVALAFVESVGPQAAGQLAGDQAAKGKEMRARYEALTGAPAPANYSEPDALAFEREYSAAQTSLSAAAVDADGLSRQLENVSRLPAAERIGQLEALKSQLAQAQNKLPALQGSVFMGNPGFSASATSTMSSFGILESSVDRERRSASKEIAATHDFSQGASTWQGFRPGFGGQPGEERLFDEALAASAPAISKMNQTLSILRNTDKGTLQDLGYLREPAVGVLQRRAVSGDTGDPLDAEKMLKEYRSASIEGDLQRMSEMELQISTLARKEPTTLSTEIGRRVDWVGQVVATESALSSLKTGVLDTIGFELDAAQALDRYGVPGKDPSGAKVWDSIVSTQHMFADPAIQDSLASGLWVGIPDDPEFDALSLSFARLDTLGKQLPQSFGAEAKSAVRQRLLARSAQNATLGPLQAPQEIIGYDDSLPRRYAAMGSNVSDRSYLPADDQVAARSKVQKAISRGSAPIEVLAQRAALNEALDVVRSKHPSDAQPRQGFFDRLTSGIPDTGTTRTAFDAEAEGDGSVVTLRDLHELMRRFAPGYEQQWRTVGSPTDRATGERSFLSGSKSLAKNSPLRQFKNIKSKLGWLDLMRGIDLEDAAQSANPAEYALLQGIQTHLRELSPSDVGAMFFSSSGTSGIPVEQLGLDPNSMDAYAAAQVVGSTAFSIGVPDTQQLQDELTAIDSAAAELNRLQDDTNSGRIVDTAPGLATEYGLLDQQLLATEGAKLAKDREVITRRLEGIRQLSAHGDATRDLAVIVGGGAFPTDAEELADALLPNQQLVSGATQDVMSSLSTNIFSATAESLRGQGEASPLFLFQQLAGTVSLTSEKSAAALFRGSTIPQGSRTAVAQEQGRSFAHSRDLVFDFVDLLDRNPAFGVKDASVEIQPYLRRGGFDAMPADTSTERQWKALALWSAGAQAYVR